MVKMPELPEVTDPAQRADLARWAVSLGRAYAAGIVQMTGELHHRAPAGESYCCLGVWSAIGVAAGRVVRRLSVDPEVIAYGPDAPVDHPGWATGQLASPIHLAGAADPDLLTWLDPEENPAEDLEELALEHGHVFADGTGDVESFVEAEAKTATAAELNDDHGLSFAQIRDVVIWRYQLTPEELAAAELAPRVPEVEGPEPEPVIGVIF